ncbi:glycoside hydrolase family 16 protein [Guyanagaster necrorhizus]|uniref:Glycoside hydrolase family 16 protein n=1 Tax=Guyanagaster necrorhizus TaxID=856835 RepID=A0A9P7W344_9AGAR|nr:glycoside hydrolase family 16 protein [Guyanagaster necrorhizus MCA 3950]KAG7451540.1 glycoside hydrolase family 16 protein [Guyanagaster necrorhizus MCA 3950]
MARSGHFDSSTISLLANNSSQGLRSRDSEWADNPYPVGSTGSRTQSLSGKFSLGADPSTWGSNLSPNFAEPDDALHLPTVRNGKMVEDADLSFSSRGIANVGCLTILCSGILALFVGYPIMTYVRDQNTTTTTTTTALGVNSSGEVPDMGNFGLIDADTPEDAYTFTSWRDGSEWQLVFSDEFETEGRTFYSGDDPYWEAVDLHYWETNNMEWYDPAAITTANGSLVITLSKKETHDLDYQGGMVATWNKFCFTGGYLAASVQLPGINNVLGLWPAVWSMGNLGRAGYGASLEGMWPYTYDSCDVGTAPNQTIDDEPTAALTSGYSSSDYALSYLPGQRLSRCTCDGESHPGPKHSDGTYVGRSAPEIDVFEAQVTDDVGYVSQSGQWAPFNKGYVWDNSSDNLIIADSSISSLNSYIGGSYQQATSVVSETAQECYQLLTGCFSTYGFEYKPGYDSDDAYITWVNNGSVAWTINAAGVGADSDTEISARRVPGEPMYILANLGMSTNFGTVDLEHLTFPAIMLIDWIRVYQDPDNINIGCDPEDFPTADYIATYSGAYTNPNYTTWVDDYGQTFPKNSLVDSC